MSENKAAKELIRICGTAQVLENEPMSRHTSFRIGGPADIFIMPDSAGAVSASIRYLKKESIPFTIIGNGTNLLVGDLGIRGAVIQLYKNFNRIRIEGDRITAQAGVMLSSAARSALEHSLTGLEFASGIPGTIGGGMIMNAGAYGRELKDVMEFTEILDEDGNVVRIRADRMEFGYRTSLAQKNGWIVLGAGLKLEHGKQDEIRARMEELRQKRVSKQPLELPSAGSTFKRPEGNFAGKLIMDAGLRGYHVGGARVSEKHCGFVVNTGGATAEDVLALIHDVQRIVEEKTGIRLEPEVKMLGEFK